MSETTNDESSKLVSATSTIKTRKEIDSQLEKLRQSRCSDFNYRITRKDRSVTRCYFRTFPEIQKVTPEDPSPERLRTLMKGVDRIGYVELKCAHCNKVYPSDPADYPLDGYVAKGEDFVSKFRAAGLEAELQYYCPQCADDYYHVKELWDYSLLLKDNFPSSALLYNSDSVCRDGAIILILKAEGEILSATIPQSIYKFKNDELTQRLKYNLEGLTPDFEYQIALMFLNNPQYTYDDYISHYSFWAGREIGVLPKLKIDKALQKVLGVKIKYDDIEMLKTLKAICRLREEVDLNAFTKIESIMKQSRGDND